MAPVILRLIQLVSSLISLRVNFKVFISLYCNLSFIFKAATSSFNFVLSFLICDCPFFNSFISCCTFSFQTSISAISPSIINPLTYKTSRISLFLCMKKAPRVGCSFRLIFVVYLFTAFFAYELFFGIWSKHLLALFALFVPFCFHCSFSVCFFFQIIIISSRHCFHSLLIGLTLLI